ncbi:MAG TPA: 16S rRNA (guanine(527)-N(7))-methyltransferase RsmG [Chloroflexota bacterium]|nr:16S rRNA (guanine(527)-N(7))-methyltransferase RsmG [Chloroflexota bacterium]
MIESAEDLPVVTAGASALGMTLSEEQQRLFAAYAHLLLEWNERVNLLGPAAVRHLWSRHLLDALTLARVLPAGAAGDYLQVIDVGSGAGLPGIPLQIAFPQWQVTLLEATGKRARFLELAQRDLDLANLRVVAGRAEEVAHDRDYREAFDLCVARAVTHTPALVELTLPFVRVGGNAVLYKTLGGLSEELSAAEPARVLLGGAPPVVTPVSSGEDERYLVRYAKHSRTPASLPRQAGIPEHRPLSRVDAERIAAELAARREGPARRVRRARSPARRR